MFAQANSSKRIRFGPPLHYPRPGEVEKKNSHHPRDVMRRFATGGH